MSTMVEMCVHMDCEGCERKIKKALLKVEGVKELEIDMEQQKVTVTGWVDQDEVLKAVRKTGRKAVLWPNDAASTCKIYTAQQYHQNQHYHPALSQNHASYDDADYSFSAPSYNYYTHGYGGGYGNYGYQYSSQPAAPMYPAPVGQRAGDMFSDENPNACSVM